MREIVFFQRFRLVIWVWVLCRYVRRFCVVNEDTSPFSDILQSVFGKFSFRRIGEHLLIGCSLFLFFCILADPQWVQENEKESKSGIDIVLLLDISTSMLAEDFSPNRLEVAKKVVSSFIGSLQTDRLGMVVFAGKPFTSVPLTFDYDFVQEMLIELNTDTINQRVRSLQGTAIWDALLSGLGVLQKWLDRDDDTGVQKNKKNKNDEEQKEREQIVVLVTDGESSPWTLDPFIVSQLAKEQSVPVYTIWIWSKQWWYITQQTPFGTQRQQIKGVDEVTLKEISSITWWTYRRVENERVFKEVFDEISTLTKSEIEMNVQRSYSPAWKPLGRVLLFCLLSLWLLHLLFPARYVWTTTLHE